MLNTVEAAKFLALKRGTLEIWRSQGKGPRFLKLGRAVRYRKIDLEEYLEGNLRRSTSDPGEA